MERNLPFWWQHFLRTVFWFNFENLQFWTPLIVCGLFKTKKLTSRGYPWTVDTNSHHCHLNHHHHQHHNYHIISKSRMPLLAPPHPDIHPSHPINLSTFSPTLVLDVLYNDERCVKNHLDKRCLKYSKFLCFGMCWLFWYFDRMGILAVSCFHRNLIRLPPAATRWNTICLCRSKERETETETNKPKRAQTKEQANK